MNDQSGTDSPHGPDEIRADIENQREELARTVDALHDTVEARAQAAVKPAVIVAGVALVALVGLVIWRRRR